MEMMVTEGIQRWDYTDERMHKARDGDYVRFTDHEQVVAELTKAHQDNLYSWLHQREEITRLSAELAAKSKDAERYQWLRQLDNAFDFRKLPRTWSAAHTPEQLDDTIDAAMGEGNGR